MPPRRSAAWLVASTLAVALAAGGCARESRAPEQAPRRLTPGTPDTAPAAPKAPTAPARAAAPAPPPVAAVAKTDVAAWSSPARQRMVGLFPARQASRERTTFLVAQPQGAAGAKAAGWLRVMLPRRPNGSTGWIRRDQVDLVTLRHRVEVDLSSRQLTLFDADRVVRRWPVAIGQPATPTPTGRFFITVKLKPPAISSVYGAFALGLSGYSNVLDQFGTGDGQIALHGTANTGSIGRAISHGCVRLDNPAIRRLAADLPLGTPVTIKG
jgi:lipoprotein-anchoring transpeptidase ErfK/SrfK